METKKICHILNNSTYIINSFNDGRCMSSLAEQFDCDYLLIEAIIRSAMKIIENTNPKYIEYIKESV
jgi:hypothetical protein